MPQSALSTIGRELLSRGISIVPIMPGEKRPGEFDRGRWRGMNEWSGYAKKLPTEEELNTWETWPEASIGLVCGELSGIIALDFDNLPELGEKIRALIPDSPVKKRGAKGFTAFYRYNGEQNYKGKHDGETVVEILSNGNQTLLPPSKHPTGINYEWVTAATLQNFDKKHLPILPKNFVEEVNKILGREKQARVYTERKNFDTNLEKVREALKFISPNDYDIWIKVGAAIYSEFPTQGFTVWNEWSKGSEKYKGEPEMSRKWLSFDKIKNIHIGSVFYHATQGGYINGIDRSYSAPHIEINLADEKISEEKPDPREGALCIDENILENTPGLVGRIAAWINETALYPHPALALGASITTVGILKAHRVRTETDLRTNLMVLGLAPSGSGKGHAVKKIEELLEAAGLFSIIGGRPVSNTAVLKLLRNGNGRRLILWDELGMALSEMTSKNSGSHKAAILRVIMEVFSKAEGILVGDEYADHDDKMKRKDIVQPCLGVYGTTTPGRFYEALTSSHVLDGFLPRWLTFETSNKYPKRKSGSVISDVPSDLIAGCQEIDRMPTNVIPRGNIDECSKIRPAVVPFCDEAKKIFNKAIEDFDKKKEIYGKKREGFDAIWARGAEHAAKLALIVEDSAEITPPSINWALSLVTSTLEATCGMVTERLVENDYQKAVNRILEVIKNGDPKGITRSALLRKIQHIETRKREDILSSLEESGMIQSLTFKSATKSAKAYRVRPAN